MPKVYNTKTRDESINELDGVIDNLQKLRISSTKYSKEYGDVIEALIDSNKILKAMSKEGKITTRSVERVNVGNYWSKDEERLLLVEFKCGRDIESIARKLGRSVDAILLRLVKLKQIEPSKQLSEKYGIK